MISDEVETPCPVRGTVSPRGLKEGCEKSERRGPDKRLGRYPTSVDQGSGGFQIGWINVFGYPAIALQVFVVGITGNEKASAGGEADDQLRQNFNIHLGLLGAKVR